MCDEIRRFDGTVQFASMEWTDVFVAGYESNLSYESTQYVSQPATITRNAR